MKSLIKTLQSLPSDQAESLLLDELRKEYNRGFREGQVIANASHEKLHTALSITKSIASLQAEATAQGHSNTPPGYD